MCLVTNPATLGNTSNNCTRTQPRTTIMPKHGLAPTREKPAATPSVVGATPTSTQVVLSNEVLLRSKIAQLQLEKAKQQRKNKSKAKNAAASSFSSSEVGGLQPTSGASSSTSSTATTTRDSGGRSVRPTRKAPSSVSKHQLASDEAGGESSPPTAVDGVGDRRAQAGGLGSTLLPDTEEVVMRRFEAQVTLARKLAGRSTENCSAQEGSSEEAGEQQPQQAAHGFTSQGIQALREMYLEQVRTARSMNKHADVLTRKTKEIEKSNEVMRAEADACTQEAARLDQAAAKLHALSAELETRRAALLKTREAEAVEETATREEMNASLNAVVGDISKKIKEQEEERLAQDAENASLRSDLQALLQSYDDNKNASEAALRAHEEEGVKLAKRLEDLTAAAQQSLEREEALTKAIGELAAGEGKLRQRVGEHATRLQRQEAGLKTYLESVQRLQAEETALLVAIARLSKEKTALLSRAGCMEAVAGNGGAETAGGGGDGGGDGGDVLGCGTGGDRDGGDSTEGFSGEAEMRALLLAKKKSAAEMESQKDRLQARCRELQAERKRIMAEAEPLAAAASEKEEFDNTRFSPAEEVQLHTV